MVRLWIVVGFVWFEHCIHLGDELAEVFQAFPPDINQVLFQRCQELLFESWIFGNKHLHHHSQSLTVLFVQLEKTNSCWTHYTM